MNAHPSIDASHAPGYKSRTAIWQFMCLVSLVLLGFVVWQAIRSSTAEPPAAAPQSIKQPQTNRQLSGGQTWQSLEQSNRQVQSDIDSSRQALQDLQVRSEAQKRRNHAFFWWLGALVLVFHIFNVLRIIRKLGRARQPVYVQGDPIARRQKSAIIKV